MEFIFKKLKRPPPKALLEPADINSKFLKEATIWGVDPGLTDIFVAADGSTDEWHRIRSVSAKEYYDMCGFNKAAESRKKFGEHDPKTKKIVDSIPWAKIASLERFKESAEYRIAKHDAICKFYDKDNR